MRSSPPESGEAEVAAHDASRSFLQGFITGILNSKSLTCFASIFVLFVPPTHGRNSAIPVSPSTV